MSYYTGCENVTKKDSTQKHFEIVEGVEQIKDEKIQALAYLFGGIVTLVIVFGVIVPMIL